MAAKTAMDSNVESCEGVIEFQQHWHAYLRGYECDAPSSDHVRQLALWSKKHEFARGEILSQPEETGDSAWLILSGWLWIVRTMDDGRCLSTELFGPGEMVGELVALTGQPFSESVECLSATSLLCVPAERFRNTCMGMAGLIPLIGRRVGERLERIETRMASFLYTTVQTRVARLLIELHDRYGDHGRLPVTLTHQEIGQLIGSNREATTRAIDGLLDHRSIVYEGHRIRLLRLDHLCAVADCDPERCPHMCRRIRTS